MTSVLQGVVGSGPLFNGDLPGVCRLAGLEKGAGICSFPCSLAPRWEARELCPGPSLWDGGREALGASAQPGSLGSLSQLGPLLAFGP